jgi:hypothetical protein
MEISCFPRWTLVVSLLATVAMGGIYFADARHLAALLGESGVIERGTALLYAVSAGIALVCAARARGALCVFALFWAALSVVCFGEETSWLQHEIGYRTPEFVRERNAQGEFNLHNLRGLHGGKVFGTESIPPALKGLASAQQLFQIGFAFFFAVLPLVIAAGPATLGCFAQNMRLPFPGLHFMLVIWPPILMTVALAVLATGITKDFAAEVRELLYAVAFLLFIAGVRGQIGRYSSASPSGSVAR